MTLEQLQDLRTACKDAIQDGTIYLRVSRCYINAARPDVVLELIDEVERLKAEVTNLRARVELWKAT